jgi:hypothetical protein
MNLEDQEEVVNKPRAQRLKRIRRGLPAAIVGTVAGLLVVLGAMVLLSDRIPEMTPELLSRAQDKWARQQLTSYRIQVTVEGRQPGVYETEVRDNRVTRSTFNDQPLTSRRTLSTWSVDGMFRTLDYDAEAVVNRREADPRLTLRAEFNSEFGFPQRYHRIEWGSTNELVWTVTAFTPLGSRE